MMPKAIFFDLDDTIVSLSQNVEKIWKKVSEDFVVREAPGFSADKLLHEINRTRNWYWSDPERHKKGRLNLLQARRDIVKKALNVFQYYNDEKSNELADRYSSLHEESLNVFPEAIETLENLSNSKIRMALITNGSSKLQRAKINKFGLEKYFEKIFVEEEVGVGKPDIRVFQIALEKLRLSPEDVWMVGDNLVWDIEAPQKIGIFSIWNDYNGEGLSPESNIVPDRIIHSIAELIE